MKGALVFLGVFAIVLVVTLGSPTLPPGRQIYDAIGGADIDYPILGIPITTLVPAVFNGVVYGVIVWLIFSFATRGKKTEEIHIEPKVTYEAPPKTDENTDQKS